MENIEKEALFLYIDQAIKEAQNLATVINRGPGGREVALTITKLQEAEDWAKRARSEIEQAKN